MKIVFIGAGNVATRMAIELNRLSHQILQIYSRTLESASLLAEQVGAKAVTKISDIENNADLYIFSVKDDILDNIANQLQKNNGIWVHTAGSLPLSILGRYTDRFGVLYPFQTFSKDRNITWKDIPIFIEASDSETLKILNTVANQLSDKVCKLSSEKRRYIHLTGIFACNFTNHMYALSELFLKQAGLPFDVVLPLIDETAAKIHTLTPEQAQTGPAIRYDENIINKHLQMIEDDKIKEIYRLISENIHKMNQ